MSGQFGYYLKAYIDRLTLSIASLPKKEYVGMFEEEMEIRHIAFYLGKKQIHVECDGYGSMNMWSAFIWEGKIKFIGAVNELTEIRKEFSVV